MQPGLPHHRDDNRQADANRARDEATVRRPYAAPQLTILGQVNELTRKVDTTGRFDGALVFGMFRT